MGAIPSGVGGHVQQPTPTWGKQQPPIWGQPMPQPITGSRNLVGGQYNQLNPPTTNLCIDVPYPGGMTNRWSQPIVGYNPQQPLAPNKTPPQNLPVYQQPHVGGQYNYHVQQ